MALYVFALLPSSANGELSRSQARNLLRRASGFELSGSSVRVKNVADTGPASAEIRADVRLVFKFLKDGRGIWRVAEIRTRQDTWEQIDVIAKAVGAHSVFAARLDPNECDSSDPPFRGSLAVDPSARRARCLLGGLFGIAVPSDAVRIQEVSPLGIPMASQPSAVVTAWITVDARAMRDKSGWRISELRTGNIGMGTGSGNDHAGWIKVESLIAAVNEEKQRQARAELAAMATALEKYRKDRGTYIISDSQAALIDHISPKYLLPVLRLDPWNQPYQYQGERDRFTLRSSGPDGKDGTSDDIAVVSRSL